MPAAPPVRSARARGPDAGPTGRAGRRRTTGAGALPGTDG
ncbi:hypothetical protein STXM2123_5458 [Streptomyces sp. F-3]|nr:hypothetical protein STXM2123_5458 [Streptomyces sp. F-3]